ncbi:ABC transporter G family member 31 [Phytophthora nicotianae]|uniref:ATPase ASNA1 homolog n=1 Tax=Phytophthora nicotianae TaxID=4792 RepID=A0A0W8CZK8_PHYNI|nr:ABC transporter G family member 31 [Phytophthora nicotianae]
MSDEVVDVPEASLRNLVAQKSLQWIFVGGKGGVGKTTTSCCLAIQLAAQREKVLIVSTDPAHNLSDAFGQKFTREPTPVNGFSNLAVMEIDPNVDLEEMNADGVQDNSGMASFMKDLTNSIPGIDEAMSFAELMKQVQNMDYSVIVFDTAPTGHTLRLLSFPTALDKAFDKILSLKNQFSGLGAARRRSAVTGNATGQAGTDARGHSEGERAVQGPGAHYLRVRVHPEFLSLYETERLVQELTKYEIDVHNVVVNQVLYPEEGSTCKSCSARQKMQQKYIDQIYDLYEDFHVVEMPLLTEEVRGVPSLKAFSENLLAPYEPNQ